MTADFDGQWKIDTSQSRVWDYQNGVYVPDEVGEELISIRTDDSVQDYEVLLGDQPTVRMGYTSRHDAAEWVPYAVREIRGIPEGESEEEVLGAFAKRIRSRVTNFRVGETYGLVRVVYVDERTHYRVSKATHGGAEYIMLRRLADDGQSYDASVLRTDGIISIVRRFVRVS
jgi:hypothetical protein